MPHQGCSPALRYQIDAFLSPGLFLRVIRGQQANTLLSCEAIGCQRSAVLKVKTVREPRI